MGPVVSTTRVPVSLVLGQLKQPVAVKVVVVVLEVQLWAVVMEQQSQHRI